MKSRLFFAVQFFLVSFLTNAQISEAIVILHDGTVLEGYAAISGNDKLKYKESKEGSSKKIHFNEIKEVNIFHKEASNIYSYERIEGNEKPKILERLVSGNVSLFMKKSAGFNSGFPGGLGSNGVGGFPSGGGSYNIKHYYLKKANQDYVKHLGSNQLFTKNFKKAITEFFKDCPLLIEKIESGEFKKRDLELIVSFYNINCN